MNGHVLSITGTQRGATQRQLRRFDAYLSGEAKDLFAEAHHGDCVGFDAEADWLVKAHGIRVILHPPLSNSKRAFCTYHTSWVAKPYLERNHDIVDCCDVLVAAPSGFVEELRSGTWASVRYARKRHKLIRIIFPDGTIVVEGETQ